MTRRVGPWPTIRNIRVAAVSNEAARGVHRHSLFAIRHHRANGVGVWLPVAVGQGPTLLATIVVAGIHVSLRWA